MNNKRKCHTDKQITNKKLEQNECQMIFMLNPFTLYAHDNIRNEVMKCHFKYPVPVLRLKHLGTVVNL